MPFWDDLGGFLNSPAGGLAIGLGTEALASGLQRRGVNQNVAAQQSAINQAGGITNAAQGRIQARNQPYADAGQQGLLRLSDVMAQDQPQSFKFDPSQVALDPGYQFRMDEATKALQRSLAARNAGGGGGAIKAAEKYSSDLASGEFSNAYNRSYQSQLDAYNSGQANLQSRFNRGLTLADMGRAATGEVNSADLASSGRMAGLATDYGAVTGGGAMANGAILGGAARRIGAATGPFARAIDRYSLAQVRGLGTPPQSTRATSYGTPEYDAETGGYVYR